MLQKIQNNPKSKRSLRLGRNSTRQQWKVVVLTQFYTPEPHTITPTIAAALAAHGHDVCVITGYPNRPGGKLYPEYQQRFGFSEVIDGIRVHRVPLVVNHSRKAVERIVNFLTFSLSALSVTPKIRNADVVYVYGTPATAGIPAQLWQKILGIPYVVHVQDLWPESVTDSQMLGDGLINRAANTVLNTWLKRFYGNAAGLIGISPGMKRLLVDRGNAPDRCSVVYNWANETHVSVKAAESFSTDGLRLVYIGNLGVMQDLQTVVQAARSFDDDPGFHLEIGGGGVLETDLHKAAEGSANITFLGRLTRAETGKKAIEADFQLVTLKDLPIFRTTVPSKLQVSLASGVPVITTVQGDVATLITEYEAGIVADPENATSLAEAFRQAQQMTATQRAQMGANARRLYLDQMSRTSGTDGIVAILQQAAHRSSRSNATQELS